MVPSHVSSSDSLYLGVTGETRRLHSKPSGTRHDECNRDVGVEKVRDRNVLFGCDYRSH
jgi:hypothetical protein